MALGQGYTGIVVALIVAFTSGVAFIICFREFVRELVRLPVPRFDKTLRKNRNVLFDDAGGFVVEDEIFSKLLQSRMDGSPSKREWQDPSLYLATVVFLGLVAAAGFVAGLSHFS